MKYYLDRIKEYDPLWDGWYWKNEISKGGFGKVFRYVKDQSGKSVYSAVKVIESIFDRGMNRETVETLINNELAILGKIKDKPNLINMKNYILKDIVKDKKVIGTDLLIQMDHMSPVSKNRLSNFSDIDVEKIAIQIAQAIKTLHDNDILHRDIKLSNILVDKNGDYVLTDFGLAIDKNNTNSLLNQRSGTKEYIAPEIWNDKNTEYNAKCDIYSYGILLYVVLNEGYFPNQHSWQTEDELKQAINSRLNGESFSEPVCTNKKMNDIVMKCASYNPDDRYNSFDEIIEDLISAVNKSTLLLLGLFDISKVIESGDNSIIEYPDGARYEGGLSDGKRNGEGILIDPNGDSYDGVWIDDEFYSGEIIWRDSAFIFDGLCRTIQNKVYPLNGVLKTGDEVYEGQFDFKNRNKWILQKGMIRYIDGAVFEGELLWNGQSHGKMIYSDGTEYEGEFFKDSRCGYGEYIDIKGNVEKGFWEDEYIIDEYGGFVDEDDYPFSKVIKALDSTKFKIKDQKVLDELKNDLRRIIDSNARRWASAKLSDEEYGIFKDIYFGDGNNDENIKIDKNEILFILLKNIFTDKEIINKRYIKIKTLSKRIDGFYEEFLEILRLSKETFIRDAILFKNTSKIRIEMWVKHFGTDEWFKSISAKRGDIVRYRVHAENIGMDVLQDFSVRDIFPRNMEYIKGSTTVFTVNHPKGVTVSDGIGTNKGINIGTFGGGADAYIYFNARVGEGVVTTKDKGAILRNIAQLTTSYCTGTVECSTDVFIEKSDT